MKDDAEADPHSDGGVAVLRYPPCDRCDGHRQRNKHPDDGAHASKSLVALLWGQVGPGVRRAHAEVGTAHHSRLAVHHDVTLHSTDRLGWGRRISTSFRPLSLECLPPPRTPRYLGSHDLHQPKNAGERNDHENTAGHGATITPESGARAAGMLDSGVLPPGLTLRAAGANRLPCK